MPINPLDLTSPADWGGHLPQPEEFETTEEYLAALESAYAAQPGLIAPEDWTSGATPMGLAASAFNRLAQQHPNNEAQNNYNALAMANRAKTRPEEAHLALSGFTLSPEGLPQSLLSNVAINQLNRYGIFNATRPAAGEGDGGTGGDGGGGDTPGTEPGKPVNARPNDTYSGVALDYAQPGVSLYYDGQSWKYEPQGNYWFYMVETQPGLWERSAPLYSPSWTQGQSGLPPTMRSAPPGFQEQESMAIPMSTGYLSSHLGPLTAMQMSPGLYPDWLRKMLASGNIPQPTGKVPS